MVKRAIQKKETESEGRERTKLIQGGELKWPQASLLARSSYPLTTAIISTIAPKPFALVSKKEEEAEEELVVGEASLRFHSLSPPATESLLLLLGQFFANPPPPTLMSPSKPDKTVFSRFQCLE
nr:uncharacterized protein LOC112002402 [Quercus suber]